MAFEMKQGSPITCGFAVQEELRTWPKLPMPKSEDAALMVTQLGTKKIGMNFAIQDESQKDRGATA